MVDHKDIARTRRRLGRRLSHARIDLNGAVEDAAADGVGAVRDASAQVTENATQAATAKEVVQTHLPSPQRSLAIGAAVAAAVLAAIAGVLARRKEASTNDQP
jgi:hypothetical protein